MRSSSRLSPWVLALSAPFSFMLVACQTQGLDDATGSTAMPASHHDALEEIGPVDTSISACDDFHAHVNKIAEDSLQISPSEVSAGVFKDLDNRVQDNLHEILESAAKDGKPSTDQGLSDRDKLGAFYRSAVNETEINKRGYDPIKPQLDAISRIHDTHDLLQYITETAGQGHSPLLGFGVQADPQHTDVQILSAHAGGTSLPTKDFYTDARYVAQRNAYHALIERTLGLIGVSQDQVKQQAEQVFSIEKIIAASELSPLEKRDPYATYSLVPLSKANEITPHILWQNVFATAKIPPATQLNVAPQRLFTTIDTLLVALPVEQWKTFLSFHLAFDASSSLSQPFVESIFDYAKEVTGQREIKPRWQRAVSAVNGSMGNAVGKLYVEKYVSPHTKGRATALIKHVLDAVKARITRVDWMTPETKQKALEKWGKIGIRVAYPDEWRNWDGLTISDSTYYENLQAARDFNRAWELSHWGKPTNKQEWITDPQVVNAFYYPEFNTINFPAAILQKPFFDPDRDLAANYGAIGAVIGHETTHAFDDQGRQFDGDGNMTDWWNERDDEQFSSRTKKLVEQFNGYHPLPNHPDLHVDGKLTLGENIADLGGLLSASDALQSLIDNNEEVMAPHDGISPQQLLFMSFALVWRGKVEEKTQIRLLAQDPHAPHYFRTNGTVSNVPAFAAAFGCAPDAPLAHTGDQLVTIW